MEQSDLGLNLTTKRTRKREFFAQMERVVSWPALVELVTPYASEGKKGRSPFAMEATLRIHFMQQWYILSDPAMEEALHDVLLFREFAGLDWDSLLPDESTIQRFRHLLERQKLAGQIQAVVNSLLSGKGLLIKAGMVVDATLNAAPSLTKNQDGQRAPKMHQSKKGNEWFFGMKTHIWVDADLGLVHTVRGMSDNVNDMVEANSLLHRHERIVYADAGYQAAAKRPEARTDVNWRIALRMGKRRALDEGTEIDALFGHVEKLKASVRAKVKHTFRVIKCQFGHLKVRYRGLKKNTVQLVTLFTLSNLCMTRGRLLAVQA